MILTGRQIAAERERGRISIEPFVGEQLEPNSYGFRLGAEFMRYEDARLDAAVAPTPTVRRVEMGEPVQLEPHRLYLARTLERMGSFVYASTLYACRSVSTLGLWIQMSAPLGHTGPAIPWTLELRAVHPLILRPGMRIGKIAFWTVLGTRRCYDGKYHEALSVQPSRLGRDEEAFRRKVST